MRKRASTSSLLTRYIAWNLCFVMIPVILMMTLYTRKTREHLIGELEAGNLASLEHMARKADSDIEAFIITATKLSSDIHITPYLLKSNSYEGIDTIKRLAIYGTQLDFVDDLLLHIRGDDKLYSGRGTTSIDLMFEQIYTTQGGWETDDFLRFIGENEALALSPAGQTLKRVDSQQQYAVIAYPWSKSGSMPFGTVIGLVNRNYWSGLAKSLQAAKVENVRILSPDQKVLTGPADDIGMDGLPLPREAGVHTIVEDGATYSVLVARAEITGNLFISYFCHNSISVGLMDIHSPVRLFWFALLVICVFFGVYMAYRNWLPIYRLSERFGRGDGEPKRRNELNALKTGIENLFSEQADLDKQMKENQSLVQQGLLAQLLNTASQVDEALIQRLRHSGVCLDGPAYCVMAASLEGLHTEKRTQLLAFCAQRGIYAVDMFYKSYIALFFSTQKEHFYAAAQQLAGDLDAAIPGILRFGVGEPCEALTRVSQSVTQAVIALETLLMAGAGGIGGGIVGRYDQLQTRQDERLMGDESLALRKMEQGIRQNNMSLCDESIQELARRMRAVAQSGDLLILRFMMDSVSLKLLEIAQACRVEDIAERIRDLIRCEGLDEFFSGVGALCAQTAQTLAEHNESAGKLTYVAVSKYLNEHVFEQNISLEGLADQFGLSAQYMSRFFREHAGITFMEYVTERRMARAEELLKTTNDPIYDIVTQIGYINTSSFTRKFTEAYGLSPGRYRKMHLRSTVLKEMS